MAKPLKIKNKNGVSYRIFVNNNNTRESKTFSTRQLAIDWVDKRKREIERAQIYGEKTAVTIKQVLQDYQAQFSTTYGRSKNYDIQRLQTYAIAELPVNQLSPKHLIQHCIERNLFAKSQTVQNDIIWLRTVLRTMAAVNGFDYDPAVFERALVVLKQERLVTRSRSRNRLPSWIEMLRLTRYFKGSKTKLPMIDIIWFAYFSARRLSEITRIEWADNNNERQTGMVRDAKHPRDKKGNHKRFKYDPSAWAIVQRQPNASAYIFPYQPKTIGMHFYRACKLLGIKDLHFHDLRHSATTRLFNRGYSIEQVQQFTLHDDWQTLARYTHIKPEDVH